MRGHLACRQRITTEAMHFKELLKSDERALSRSPPPEMRPKMSLARKTLFITALRAAGIGLRIALRAARDGANIAIAQDSSRTRSFRAPSVPPPKSARRGRACRSVDVRDEAW
jgi:hypothetical protein